nr:DUF499 domain-containing protein [Ferrimicrobium acidiphilum]
MLSTVRDLCVLIEGADNIRVSDGIERVDEESLSFSDGERFLSQSYLTAGMTELVQEGFKRLSGSPGNRAVFRLKQAMGGGKTHLIRTMAFLSRHPQLREQYFPTANARYPFSGAKVCFFNGREQPDDFFWGQIAAQLDHPGFFRAGVQAPGQEHWEELFGTVDAPILILLDEMPTYFEYYRTQTSGDGTIADVAGRAFANLLTCVQGLKNVCIVISELEASHAEGTHIMNSALDDARKELSRVEFNITPVDLSGDETYAILKKRLFARLPDETQIAHIAQQFAKAIENAQRSKTIEQQKTPEQLALEIEQTYPFHPQMKHIFALFKENKEFQQTRGLMELASRLIRSVWERSSNDVMLIGPQHFDFSIDDVREKIISISKLDEAVAKDIYSNDGSAHAQTLDVNSGNDAASQLVSLLLVSSLSTAVNPVKGLTKSEALECLATPNSDLSFFQDALESLISSCWYLHRSDGDRIYFDKLENLTKMLKGLADSAPEPKVTELVAHRLTEMFEPKRKAAYQKVLALPLIDEIDAAVQNSRVLAIVAPDSKLPPDEISRLFGSLVRKNNLIVLTGQPSFEMKKLWEAARSVYASSQAGALKRIDKGSPQWEEYEDLKVKFDQDLTGVLKTLFDKLFYPYRAISTNGLPELKPSKGLESVGDTNAGEAQIEATLTKDPVKLYLDWEQGEKFSGVITRIEQLFGDQDVVPWSDIREKTQTDAAMYFLAPGDLDRIRSKAVNEGRWEDQGNGWITKKPKPKEAKVSVIPVLAMDDNGNTILEVSVQNSNPETTTIYYAEDGEVSTESSKLTDSRLSTKAMRVSFLAVDRSGRMNSAAPFIWSSRLVIQHNLVPQFGTKRMVTINVLPSAEVIRYTLNGAEPRDGIEYNGPFEIDDQRYRLLVFAENKGISEKADFQIHAGTSKTINGIEKKPVPDLPLTKPVFFPVGKIETINARDRVFKCLENAKQRQITFSWVEVTVSEEGQRQSNARLQCDVKDLSAGSLLELVNSLTTEFQPTAELSLKFRDAFFPSGQDLRDFADFTELSVDDSWKEA